MAKRKAMARTRTAARRPSRKPARKAGKPARKGAAAKTRAKAARRSTKSVAARKPVARKAVAPKAKLRGSTPIRPKPAALSRERRHLREEEMVPTPPSTLRYEPKASPAETGHNHYHQKMREHTEGGPALTGGDIDADWNEAYSSGEETPGGDMPTPDQDVVEEIGRALGVEYEDAEELKGAEKIEDRDRHRWEYDPASAEDYRDRNRRDED
jgi:hypothetical protein